MLLALAAVAALGVGAFVIWERHDMAKAFIQSDLSRQRATDVVITPDWMDFDRDTLTYDVTYTDTNGRHRRNRCKVGVRPGADGTVYWSSAFD